MECDSVLIKSTIWADRIRSRGYIKGRISVRISKPFFFHGPPCPGTRCPTRCINPVYGQRTRCDKREGERRRAARKRSEWSGLISWGICDSYVRCLSDTGVTNVENCLRSKMKPSWLFQRKKPSVSCVLQGWSFYSRIHYQELPHKHDKLDMTITPTFPKLLTRTFMEFMAKKKPLAYFGSHCVCISDGIVPIRDLVAIHHTNIKTRTNGLLRSLLSIKFPRITHRCSRLINTNNNFRIYPTKIGRVDNRAWWIVKAR